MGARGKALDRVAVLDRAGNSRFWCDSRGVFGVVPARLVALWGFIKRSEVGLRRLPFQASLATPVTMAPRRRPREGVAEQATRQEAGDAPPPQQTQPLPQDAHSGIALPPPPPQPPQFLGQPDPDAARAWLDAVERTFCSMDCVPEERVLLASY
ncbi:hypothetical protein Taro_016071 [Colocasia esculenta]|uniref:Uncharacterized protein n=1 Tax=Colocasia esculenta TaxID=4460 RepID=A0A843UJ92_COLES|nr:hypothetical protein [Colocasia esculenta]